MATSMPGAVATQQYVAPAVSGDNITQNPDGSFRVVTPYGEFNAPTIQLAQQVAQNLQAQTGQVQGQSADQVIESLITNGVRQADGSYRNLASDELAALIDYRNRQLAQVQVPQVQNAKAIADATLAEQAKQYQQSLFFQEQQQRAQEKQAADALAQQERNRQTTELGTRLGADVSQLGLASSDTLGRNTLASQTLSQAEAASLARSQAQADQALKALQLAASLGGPSNAFKNVNLNLGLNAEGLSPLAAILAGKQRAAVYQAPQSRPEAMTLDTLARDMGGTPPPLQAVGDAVSGQASGTGGGNAVLNAAPTFNGGSEAITALLNLAAQNASPTSAVSQEAMRQAQINARSISALSGDTTVSAGAQLAQLWRDILRADNGKAPSWDDQRIINGWMQIGHLSDAQARAAASYAHDYPSNNSGNPMSEGQLNDLVGQVAMGTAIDPSKWREPGKGYVAPPTKDQFSGGARILQEINNRAASGQSIDDDYAKSLYVAIAGVSQAGADVLHNYAKQYYKDNGVPLNEGQLNDMIGQVLAGGVPDKSKWRQPGAAFAKSVATPTPGVPPAVPPVSAPSPIAPPPKPGDPSYVPPAGPALPPGRPSPTLPDPNNPGAPTVPGGPPNGPTPTPIDYRPPGYIPGNQPAGLDRGAAIAQQMNAWSQAGHVPTEAEMTGLWQAQGLTPDQANVLHQYAKNYYVTNKTPMTTGQINDAIGQVMAGQSPDATKWRNPGTSTVQGAAAQVTGGYQAPQATPAPPATPIENSAPTYSQSPTNPDVMTMNQPPAPKTGGVDPSETFTYDWLPGGKLGYRGSKGTMVDQNWQPYQQAA